MLSMQKPKNMLQKFTIKSQKAKETQTQNNSNLKKCIKLLQDSKQNMNAHISKAFNDLRHKVAKIIDKSQKNLEISISKSFNNSISILNHAYNCSDLNKLEIKQYNRKIQKLLQDYNIKTVEIVQLTNSLQHKLKQFLDKFKAEKVLKDFSQLKENVQILVFTCFKKMNISEPVKNLAYLNSKVVMITEKYVQIQHTKTKYTLNKNVDLVLPIKITKKILQSTKQQSLQNITSHKQVKHKNFLLCLYNNDTLSFYTDKLILHSHKKFDYDRQLIVGACQIGNYIIIAQRNRLIRLNALDLNQKYIKSFINDITGICNQQYYGMLPISDNNGILFLNIMDFQILNLIKNSNVETLRSNNDFMMVGFNGGWKVFQGMECIGSFNRNQHYFIDAVSLTSIDWIFITKQSQFIHYRIEQEQQTKNWKVINTGCQSKNITGITSTNQGIITLGTNGTKIYIYEY